MRELLERMGILHLFLIPIGIHPVNQQGRPDHVIGTYLHRGIYRRASSVEFAVGFLSPLVSNTQGREYLLGRWVGEALVAVRIAGVGIVKAPGEGEYRL